VSPFSSGCAKREPNGKHHERRDLVRDERPEGAVTYLEVGQRIGLLDADAQAIRERLSEPGNPGAAATGVDAAQLTGASRRREERCRALDADGDLFA